MLEPEAADPDFSPLAPRAWVIPRQRAGTFSVSLDDSLARTVPASAIASRFHGPGPIPGITDFHNGRVGSNSLLGQSIVERDLPRSLRFVLARPAPSPSLGHKTSRARSEISCDLQPLGVGELRKWPAWLPLKVVLEREPAEHPVGASIEHCGFMRPRRRPLCPLTHAPLRYRPTVQPVVLACSRGRPVQRAAASLSRR